MTEMRIQMVEGAVAPRYDEAGLELELEGVTVTEQGTAARLPLVDFRMRGPGGELYLLVVTGRHVCALAAAVRGANARNHGVEEP